MPRIGLVGTENSHTDHFIRFLNDEERHPGYRAIALAGGRTDRNAALAERGGIDLVVEEAADLIGQVDAVIVSNRDGAAHRRAAEPLLTAGIAVLVDKPLATRVDDAEAIVAAAARGGAALVSCSALRFVPEIRDLREAAGKGAVRTLTVIGPADPDSEYSGLSFYGIHHVEAALEILGNPVVEPDSLTVTVVRHGATVLALTRIDGVELVLTFIRPEEGVRVPFAAVLTTAADVVAHHLTLSGDYNAPALQRFVTAVDTGESPAGRGDLLSPVVVLETIMQALDEEGRR